MRIIITLETIEWVYYPLSQEPGDIMEEPLEQAEVVIGMGRFHELDKDAIIQIVRLLGYDAQTWRIKNVHVEQIEEVY